MKTLAREEDTAEILRRIRQVRPDSVRRWGCMSAHQMVCHLTDACRMALGETAVSSATGRLRRPDFNWPVHPIFGRMSHREWLRWAYLHADHHLRQFGV
jgi:hypothetical protein